jgi:micrococcal nuclease
MLGLGLVVALRACQTLTQPGDQSVPVELIREGVYEVVRVVDGDTIEVAFGGPSEAEVDRRQRQHVRVRLIGIDAPESVQPNHPVEYLGPEAADFAREFLSSGTAYLRFDRRRLDQYGRLLAYVFRDQTMQAMLNEELVRAGLARADHYRGDSQSMALRIRKAQEEAQAARRGVWAPVAAAGNR